MIRSFLAFGLTGAFWTSCAFSSELPATKGDEAIFNISQTVIIKDPPRFGVNFIPPSMTHWDTEPWHNQWWSCPNPNPVTARIKGTATGGSATTLEDRNKSPGLGYYDIFRNGFFSGGDAAVYRFDQGKMFLKVPLQRMKHRLRDQIVSPLILLVLKSNPGMNMS